MTCDIGSWKAAARIAGLHFQGEATGTAGGRVRRCSIRVPLRYSGKLLVHRSDRLPFDLKDSSISRQILPERVVLALADRPHASFRYFADRHFAGLGRHWRWLATVARFRHPLWMTSVIARLRYATRRHRGLRCLSVVLAFALMLVTWPQLELHSHVKGDHAHSHSVEHHAHDHQIPEDLDAPGVMHLHDASSVAWTLPSCQAQIAAVPLAAWNPAPTFDSGTLAAPPPPHRPPIA
jgi:hypothetical protein